MQLMKLKEWSALDATGKSNWLATQTVNDLEHILAIVGEMLEHVDDLDAELAMLPQNDDLDAVRISTSEALRDMEKCIVITLNTYKQAVQCN